LAAGFEPLRGDIVPTVTDGRWPAAEDEAALGRKTMRRLDVELGDAVQAIGQDGGRRTLDVVGEVLFPVVTPDVSTTADVGDGMALTANGLDALAGEVRRSTYYVDFAQEGRGIAGLRSAYGDLTFGPQQPPDINNYERVRPVPVALAALIGLLGAAMLALGLMGAVRNRSRDLAVLRTLGFDGRQVGWTVTWQASVLAVVALLLGIPAGVVLGRQAWLVLADRLAVPVAPASSVLLVVVAVVVTLGLANAAAGIAGIRARRLRPADVLRSE
jgi:ABC-type lipoprotein release transport system permease subunit